MLDSNSIDKLDPKAKRCYLIGYGFDMYGYKLWDDKNKKIIRSRNVTFNENMNKQPEHVSLEEISESDVANRRQNTEVEPESEPESEFGSEPEQIVESVTPELLTRRSSRTIVAPQRYSPSLHYLLLTDAGELEHFAEAMQGSESIKWELAMEDEIKSLQKNKTWSLTKLPEGKKVLQNKWVYRLKEEPDGSKRYKARLVVKGFQQRQGIEFTKIFSPIVKMTTIKVILSLVAAENLHLEQLDVKTGFLHGDLEEEIFMTNQKVLKYKAKRILYASFIKGCKD